MHGSNFLGVTKFQDFSRFFQQISRHFHTFVFLIKICKFKEPLLNKNWSFLLHFISKTSLSSLFQQFRGCCIVPAPDKKQKTWCLPLFQVLYHISRIFIEWQNSRIFPNFPGYCDFSMFPGWVETVPMEPFTLCRMTSVCFRCELIRPRTDDNPYY